MIYDKHLIGQPEDFGYPAARRDSQSVQTYAVVWVPHVNATVNRTGDEQPTRWVEIGGGNFYRQNLTVHLLGVRHRPFDDHVSSAQVPHGDGRVGGGHGYQYLVQRIVQRPNDWRVV